nr:IclR family transcriptional regulator [Nocardioidaceae bacterium]
EGTYEAGSLFAAYASRHDRLDDFVALARPTLEQISDATGETVNLAVARGRIVAQVAQVDSTYLLGTTNWLDVDVPAHCSALGKVLYAAGLIPVPDRTLEARTPHTITDPDKFRRHLDTVRAQGFAQALGELEIGLDAIAAPVFGRSGEVVAAVGISGPSGRLSDKLPQLGSLIKKHAQALSGVLGHQPRKEGAA